MLLAPPDGAAGGVGRMAGQGRAVRRCRPTLLGKGLLGVKGIPVFVRVVRSEVSRSED
jgi:hypothetical protein